MNQVFIKNGVGIVIGYSLESQDVITYFHYRHGHLGTFTKSTKQYYRVKTYPGGEGTPWNGQDWGITDVLYWDPVK